MAGARFLIGGGENLSESTKRLSKPPGKKAYLYSVAERQAELNPQWEKISSVTASLPETACPGGQTVIAMTLHPSFLARSYYPDKLFKREGLRPVGSRLIEVAPKKPRSKRGVSKTEDPSAQLFLALDRDRLPNIAADLLILPEVSYLDEKEIRSNPTFAAAQDYMKVECVAPLGLERIKPIPEEFRHSGAQVPIEVVLHAGAGREDDPIRSGFVRHARRIGLTVGLDRARTAGGLTFLPFYAPFEMLETLAQFSFLRVLRRVPTLGRLTPASRSLGPAVRLPLPQTPAAHEGLRVAIFDGGLPENHGLGNWVTARDAAGIGTPDAESLEHGVQVTSAFLFGHLSSKDGVQVPVANVEHIRVLDVNLPNDDFQLYTVLERIENSLKGHNYDLVNISMGPSQAMLDDDIDPWTVSLDKFFSRGTALCTVACGNDGHLDALTQLNRVQPPSDGVNLLGVGAADSLDSPWARAAYSCIGPGRSPGIVKPDLVAFGGTEERPFLAWTGNAGAKGTAGTSFAAPSSLRMAAGLRAQFEADLWAPTVKALLIHHADPRISPGRRGGEHPKSDVGWGRISHRLEEIVLCGDGEARVVYQVELPPGAGKQLYLPVPSGLTGYVEISATICFYSDTDPEDSANYTCLGLEPTFRPHIDRYDDKSGKKSRLPKSASFFTKSAIAAEVELRDDAHKWETTRHAVRRFEAPSLHTPYFEVFCVARQNGQRADHKEMIRLGAVITVRCEAVSDLYDRVLRAYAGRLRPLSLRAQAPIKVGI